jgi:hypothetical protein
MVAGNLTSVGGFVETIFSSLEQGVFGSTALMFLFLLIVASIFLFRMGMSRFAVMGFGMVLLLGLATYGYTYIGWLAGLVALLLGVLLWFLYSKIFGSMY